MSSTPPPTSRVHTPPTPRHGSRHDNWEPYSPRRSTRVSSRRNMARLQSPDVAEAGPSSSSRLSASMFNTSTPRKVRRTSSSQTLSPPSSPEFEHRPQQQQQQQQLPAIARALFNSRDDHHPTSESHVPSFRPSPATMLPTPAKTPRKPAADISMPTARILNFKPGSLEDVMPTPRKQRKSRLTLFAEDAPQPEKIAVFTDAQDRVPDLDNSEDNPFLGPRKKDTKPSSSKNPSSPEDGNVADMEEAVRNNEGLIYVFRGKKIFRPFASSSADNKASPEPADQANIKRKAGVASQRPMTRSTVKPRLLWPSEEQVLEKEARDAALNEDEEADTDIEQEHLPLVMSAPALAKDLVTPAKKLAAQPAHVLTPPSSHRATRSASKKLSFFSNFETIPESTDTDTPASPAATPLPQHKAGTKRASPFENWQRTKASISSGVSAIKQGKKRAHSPGEQTVRKRTRVSSPASDDV